ncbi:MAG: hypothetical protein IJ039_05215 [Clostridia bacterium]|nr:hypothetical protein [Clostridia bacterium]
MTYTVPKKVFTRESKIDRMEIFFSNGDYFTIRKNEICNVSITFYDRLVKKGVRYYAVGHSGFIKLRIQPGKAKMELRCLHNSKEYVKNRKQYIENRTTTESYIEFIELYNQLNWSDCIYGEIYATLEGEYLYIRFKENERYGAWESNKHCVDIAPPSKDMIFKMNVDFENCDGIDVYNSEIEEMNLEFSEELAWESDGYVRRVKGGYLKIKFDKCYQNRKVSLICDAKKGLKHLEKRICGKGTDVVDICHLYMEFYRCYGQWGEVLTIDSINKYEAKATELSIDDYGDYNLYYEEHIDESEDEEAFVSGHAEKLKNGSIIIVFGE